MIRLKPSADTNVFYTSPFPKTCLQGTSSIVRVPFTAFQETTDSVPPTRFGITGT